MRFKTSQHSLQLDVIFLHSLLLLVLVAVACSAQQRFTPLGTTVGPVSTESNVQILSTTSTVPSSSITSSQTNNQSIVLSTSTSAAPVATQPIGIVSLLSTTSASPISSNNNAPNSSSTIASSSSTAEARTASRQEEVASTSSAAYVTADTLTELASNNNDHLIFNICSSNPCQNGAECHNVGDTNFTCECTQGFLGPLCDQLYSSCTPNPCTNNGNCVSFQPPKCLPFAISNHSRLDPIPLDDDAPFPNLRLRMSARLSWYVSNVETIVPMH